MARAGDQAAAGGDATKATEYTNAAEAFAAQLVTAEQSVEDLKTLHDQALQAAVDAVPGAQLRSLSASALFRTRDLAAGRAFDAVAATRLDGATHAVLVGSSRDHAAVGDLLVGTGFAARLKAAGPSWTERKLPTPLPVPWS